jgi:hypothetical protein
MTTYDEAYAFMKAKMKARHEGYLAGLEKAAELNLQNEKLIFDCKLSQHDVAIKAINAYKNKIIGYRYTILCPDENSVNAYWDISGYCPDENSALFRIEAETE